MRSHLIPNILKCYLCLQHFIFVSAMNSSCQVIDISQSSAFNLKVNVGTHFTLGKSLVHQEFSHPVVPCQTQRSYSVISPEEENHPPSTLCIGVIGSILFYYVSISGHWISRSSILNFVEIFLLHSFVSLSSYIGFHLQPCRKG